MEQKGDGKSGRVYREFHNHLLFYKCGRQFAVGICRNLWPNTDNEHPLSWEEFASVYSLQNLLMYIGGDFNIIRFSSECSRICRLGLSMTEFFDFFIFELSLVDLPLINSAFTWSNDHMVV